MRAEAALHKGLALGAIALATAVLASAGPACTPAATPDQPPPASTQVTPAAPPSLELTHRFGSQKLRHGQSIRRAVLLGSTGMLASIGRDAVRVWNREGEQITAILGRAVDIAALPGTATLVVAEARAVAAFQIEPSGAKPLWRAPLPEDVVPFGLQASKDMIRVVIAGKVVDLDPATGNETLSHGPFPWLKKIKLASVAPDGSGVIVCNDDGTTFYPLAPRGGSPASGPVKLSSSTVTSIAVSPDSTFALTTNGGHKSLTKAWNLPSGELRWSIEPGYPDPPAIGISQDGSRVVTVGKEDGIAVRDARTGAALQRLGPALGSFDFEDPAAPVFDSSDSSIAAFSADNKKLVWGAGNTLRFWDLEKGAETRPTDVLGYRLQALSPAGDRAVMSGAVWDLDRKQPIFDVRKATPEDPFVLGAVFTGGSSSLMTFRLGTVELWDIDKKRRGRHGKHRGAVGAGVAFAEHALFAVEYSSGEVTIWREQDNKPWKEMDRNGRYSSADDSYFPDPAAGKGRFALPLRDGVEIFDAATGESVGKLSMHEGPRGVACSEDGRSLAAALPAAIEIWNLETRALVQSFEVESPTCVELLSGTSLLFYGLTNGSIGIYDTARRAGVALVPAAHHGRVRDLRAAAGRLLSSGSEETVAVWQIQP